MNDFNEWFSEILVMMSDHTTDPDRPFTGQPHTNQGERGKTDVTGIRFRDMADCLAKALIDAGAHTVKDRAKEDELRQRADDGTLNYNDLYSIECGDMDPVALIQCMSVRVEQQMGIYPNVPATITDQASQNETET